MEEIQVPRSDLNIYSGVICVSLDNAFLISEILGVYVCVIIG